jgi:PAS domain S-box-containing protein
VKNEAEKCFDANKTLMKNKEKICHEQWVQNSDGHKRYLSINKEPVFGSDGSINYIVGSASDITSQKITENELKQENKLLTDIFENIQDGLIVLDTNFNIIYVNNIVKQYYKDKLPLEGKKCYSIFYDRDEPCIQCPTQRCLKTGETEFEIINVNTSTEDKWAQFYSYPVFDNSNDSISSVIEFVRDITERKKVNDKLLEIEESFYNLAENAPIGILTCNKDGYIEYVNPKLVNMMGSPGKKYTKKINVLKYPPIVEIGFSESIKTVLDTGITINSFEKEYVSKWGVYACFRAHISPLKDVSNNIRGAQIIIDDITHNKENEYKLQEYARELENLNETKQVFTDILRHDLLNPIGVAKNYTEILYKKETDESKLWILDRIRKSNKKALDLVENAGKLAKIECMNNIEFENLDLVEMVNNLLDDFKTELDNKNIDINFEYNNNGSCFAKANSMIRQALSNLIDNSIKYSPPDSSILLDIVDSDNYWKIRINDSGPGIPDSEKPYIFDRFRRCSSQNINGNGLGLAIVKKIADLHDGDVGTEDHPKGKGSVFWITVKKSN